MADTPFTYSPIGASGYSGISGFPGTSVISVVYNNNFQPGQAIYRVQPTSATLAGFALACANAASSVEVIGVVQAATIFNFTAVVNGSITGLSGLNDGWQYYLSDQYPGTLVSTPPSAVGSIIKPVMIATGTATGQVVEYPGILISGLQTIAGSGISGYYGKWTQIAQIQNGLISDDGVNINVNSPIALSGITTVANTFRSQQIYEAVTLLSTINVAGQITFPVLSSSLQYYTLSASGNFNVNFVGSTNGLTYNQVSEVGRSASYALMVTTGALSAFLSAIYVDGISVSASTRWTNGASAIAGDINSVDMYTFTVIKTTNIPTYSVFASQIQFK